MPLGYILVENRGADNSRGKTSSLIQSTCTLLYSVMFIPHLLSKRGKQIGVHDSAV